MANKKWCESFSAGDCLADGEWDDMVTYIKHSAVTDFTIYSNEGTCSDTVQAFRFTKAGSTSRIYGGLNSGDILEIWASEADARPYIKLTGNGKTLIQGQSTAGKISILNDLLLYGLNHIRMYDNNVSTWDFERTGVDAVIRAATNGDFNLVLQYAANGFQFISVSTDIARLSYSGNITSLKGSNISGDDFDMYANTQDANPILHFDGGNGNIQINSITALSAHFDLALLGDGVLCMKETTTPTADANHGKLYFKADNKLYAQDGAGVEHEVAYVP